MKFATNQRVLMAERSHGGELGLELLKDEKGLERQKGDKRRQLGEMAKSKKVKSDASMYKRLVRKSACLGIGVSIWEQKLPKFAYLGKPGTLSLGMMKGL